MKVLYYLRHSLKDYKGPNKNSKGQRLGEEGLKLAQELGKKFNSDNIIITDCFAGELPRTWETLAGFLTTYTQITEVAIHPHLPIGHSKEIFSPIKTKIIKLTKAGYTNWQAVKKISLLLARDLRQESADCVITAFNKMEKSGGRCGVMFGHSPLIEAAAEFFSLSPIEWQPDPCEGFKFTLDERGNTMLVEEFTL